ncbi:unnamed protein product [Calicophoron daubneyi]|uniref:Major facilitator superfamily associated domain-containing protein n=1 Tax=Calicophoron daubneyi TaxID=300641 RepID=A0AAV2T3M5_CALDB
MVPDDEHEVGEKTGEEGRGVRKCSLEINQKLIPVKINYFCQFVVIGAFFNYANPILSTYGLNASELGVTVMFSYVSATVARLVLGPVMDHAKRKHLVIATLSLATAITIALFFVIPSSKEYAFEGYVLPNQSFVAQVSWPGFPNSSAPETLTARGNYSKFCWPTKLMNCQLRPENDTDRQTGTEFALISVAQDFRAAVYGIADSDYFTGVANWSEHRQTDAQLVCGRVELNSTDSCVRMKNEHTRRANVITFIIIIFLRSLVHAFHAPLCNLLDSATYGVLGEAKSRFYGHTRAFGSLGYTLSSLATGYLIYRVSIHSDSDNPSYGPLAFLLGDKSEFLNYSPCLVISVIFAMIGAVISLYPTMHAPSTRFNLRKALSVAIRSLEMVKCLVNATFTGFINAFINEYLFLILIKEIKVPQYFLGIMTTAYTVTEIPAFVICGYLVNSLGETVCISIGHLLNLVRFISFAYFENYWCFLYTELLCGNSYALIYNAVLNQGAKAGRKSHEDAGDVVASMQGITTSVLCSFVPCISGLLWGILLDYISGRKLFYIAGAYSLFVSILVFVIAILADILIPRDQPCK